APGIDLPVQAHRIRRSPNASSKRRGSMHASETKPPLMRRSGRCSHPRDRASTPTCGERPETPDPRSGGPMPDLVIRPAVQDDLDVLWDFLAMATYEPHAAAAKAVPLVAKYLVGWQRPGDFGFIAEQHGEVLGAAWARRFATAELRSPYGAEET